MIHCDTPATPFRISYEFFKLRALVSRRSTFASLYNLPSIPRFGKKTARHSQVSTSRRTIDTNVTLVIDAGTGKPGFVPSGPMTPLVCICFRIRRTGVFLFCVLAQPRRRPSMAMGASRVRKRLVGGDGILDPVEAISGCMIGRGDRGHTHSLAVL